jgi:hypothetical protein
MINKENFEVLAKILDRADDKHLLTFDRLSLMMDLECAMKEFNLSLDELLNADDFNFTHDICGIQRHINRRTMEFENFFVPRFAR